MRPFVQVGRVEFPQVPHRRVAVTDVARRRRHEYAFSRSRLAGDDEIVSAQIEVLKRHGHQGQQRAVAATQAVEERWRYLPLTNDGAHLLGVVEERKKLGRRKQAAERFHYFFAASHLEQPVVDDGNAHSAFRSVAPRCKSPDGRL